jgi:hypothetical protein
LAITGDYTNYDPPACWGGVLSVMAILQQLSEFIADWEERAVGIVSELPIIRGWPYCGLRFSGLPIASRKIALLCFACGEKKLTTSSSKKVSPVAPRCWAYAAR